MKQDREQYVADLKVQSLQIAAKLIKDNKLKSSLIPLSRKIFNFLLEGVDLESIQITEKEVGPQIM